MSRLIARKDEKVTRENGEYICRVASDLHSQDPVTPDAFEDWQIEKPRLVAPFDAYKRGESYIRSRGFSFVIDLHLERGWSNETDPPEHSERPE